VGVCHRASPRGVRCYLDRGHEGDHEGYQEHFSGPPSKVTWADPVAPMVFTYEGPITSFAPDWQSEALRAGWTPPMQTWTVVPIVIPAAELERVRAETPADLTRRLLDETLAYFKRSWNEWMDAGCPETPSTPNLWKER
jgi:hypothetical protein